MRVPQTVADMHSTQDPAKHGAPARRCSPKFDTGCLLQCRRVAVKTASIGNRRFRGWVFQVTSVAVAVRLKLCSHYSAPHFLLRQQSLLLTRVFQVFQFWIQSCRSANWLNVVCIIADIKGLIGD